MRLQYLDTYPVSIQDFLQWENILCQGGVESSYPWLIQWVTQTVFRWTDLLVYRDNGIAVFRWTD